MKKLTLILGGAILILGSSLLYNSNFIESDPVPTFIVSWASFFMGILCWGELLVREVIKRDNHV